MVNFKNDDLEYLLDTSHRHYLPGYGRLSFMLMLKSLIDPSAFRVEQQIIRGMAFHFARAIINNDPDTEYLPEEKINNFYNAVETLFIIREGETTIQHDHSMSYRHRNQYHYPYQDFTFQELTGIINLLYIRIVQPTPLNRVDLSTQFFTDWDLALLQLTGVLIWPLMTEKDSSNGYKQTCRLPIFREHISCMNWNSLHCNRSGQDFHCPLKSPLQGKLLKRKQKSYNRFTFLPRRRNLGKQIEQR